MTYIEIISQNFIDTISAQTEEVINAWRNSF
jgi:hypothetical protein